MDEENISWLESDALSSGNCVQLLDGDLSCVEDSWFEALRFGPAFVVEEDSTANDTPVFYPDYKLLSVYSGNQIGYLTMSANSIRIMHILLLTPIEKYLMILISCSRQSSSHFTLCTSLTKVPKPIPLGATLRIEHHCVVVDRPGLLVLNRVFEFRSPKPRYFRLVQSPVCAYPDAVDDFFCCGECGLRCEAIQHSQLVGGAIETPRIASGPVFFEGEGGERGCLLCHFEVSVGAIDYYRFWSTLICVEEEGIFLEEDVNVDGG